MLTMSYKVDNYSYLLYNALKWKSTSFPRVFSHSIFSHGGYAKMNVHKLCCHVAHLNVGIFKRYWNFERFERFAH